MSTTIKRVALVAVAALSLGVISVAPSQAVTQSDSLTLSAATASQLTGETLTAGAASTTVAFLGGSTGDTYSVSAFLFSAPAGNVATPVLSLVETTSALVAASAPVTNVAAGTALGQVAYVSPAANTSAVSAKFNVYLNGPTVAGTYVVKLAPAIVSGGGTASATTQTLTITVATNPASDKVAKTATIILNSGETDTATTDATVTAAKGASLSAAAATLTVALKNAGGFATTGESYTATVSGPGLLASGTVAGNPTATGRALTVQAGHVVQLFPDGTSGVSTVTISSAAGLVLGSKSVTFFGAAATISTPTVVKSVIGTGGTTGVLTVSIKDAAGVNVSNLAGTLSVVSDSATIASSVYAAGGTYDATTGLYTVGVTGNAAGVANIKVTTNASSTDTTGITSAAVAVRVGSYTPASVKVTTDKASYAPGEKATITVSLADANGLDLVSGETYTAIFAAGGITSSYTLGGGSATISGTDLISYAAGGKTFDVYLPVTEGDVKFSWTSGSVASGTRTGLATANQAVAGSVTVSVSSVATSAAIDAANEAAQAASDATDAALAAADAADAATTKAQEAVDAVATLSAQVSKLITALKAQITTLTNLVIKIQKKVKA